jgi:hypothetical protein
MATASALRWRDSLETRRSPITPRNKLQDLGLVVCADPVRRLRVVQRLALSQVTRLALVTAPGA